VRAYADILPDRLTDYLGHLTGQTVTQWSMAEFQFKPLPKSRRDRDEGWEDVDEDESDGESRERGRSRRIRAGRT